MQRITKLPSIFGVLIRPVDIRHGERRDRYNNPIVRGIQSYLEGHDYFFTTVEASVESILISDGRRLLTFGFNGEGKRWLESWDSGDDVSPVSLTLFLLDFSV